MIRGNPRLRDKGMLSIEFVVLIVVMASALAGMAVYMRRALSGRWRSVGDTFGHGRQYERQSLPPQPTCLPDGWVCQQTSWKCGVWAGQPPFPNRCGECCAGATINDRTHQCFEECSGPDPDECDCGLCLGQGQFVCGAET